MNYSSTRTIESKTQSGVRFVLRKMNWRRREKLEDLQSEATAKMRPLLEEYGPLNRDWLEAVKAARAVHAKERQEAIAAGAPEKDAFERFPIGRIEYDNDRLLQWARLKDEIAKIERLEMEPIAAKFVVDHIEDFEVDGYAVKTFPELEELGPDDLRDEIVLEVKRELGLLPAEVQNLSSPSTTGAAVDGESRTGDAPNAATTETTTSAAAGSSTGPGSASVPSTGSTP